MKPGEIKKFRPGISNFLAVIGSLGLFIGIWMMLASFQDIDRYASTLALGISSIGSGILLIAISETIAFLARANAWSEQIHSINAETIKALQWIIDNWSERK